MYDNYIVQQINELESAAKQGQQAIDNLIKLCDDWRKLNEDIQLWPLAYYSSYTSNTTESVQ